MQHLLRDNLLGMKPFLPDLIIAPGLGGLLIILQLVQDPGLLLLLQPGDQTLGGVFSSRSQAPAWEREEKPDL